jgi:hypothetical protein
MKNFTSLKLKDYLSLLVVFIIELAWVHVDQNFLSQTWEKFIALFVLTLFLLYMQFLINKPQKTYNYANSIALILVSLVVILSIVLHVFINHNFSFKLVLIWLIAAVLPYVTGYIYQATKKK